MPGTDNGSSLLRISTDDFPENDRLDVWTEGFSKTLLPCEFDQVPDRPLSQSATLRKLPGLSMVAGEGLGLLVNRTRRQIYGGVNDFFLHVQLKGACQFSQLRRELTAGPGDAFMISSEDVLAAQFPGTFEHISFGVPRQALLDRLPNPEASVVRLLPRSSEALRLLTGYLSLLNGAGVQMAPDTEPLGSVYVNHVHDLLALTLRSTGDTWDRAKGSIRAARLHAIKQDILAYLGQPGLSVNAVAVRQGISPRYIQKLFDLEGTTFTEFVLGERLSRARRMLADPRLAGQTIASIAYDAGFADLSNFNRGFRQRYGVTPSDVRPSAKAGCQPIRKIEG